MSKIFIYGEKEIEYLKKVDSKLGAIIDEIGPIEREVIPDLFTSLISSIVGQQISTKAADTVWKRLVERIGEIKPETVYNTSLEKIQQCGMSIRKANYIKDTTTKVISGELNIGELYTLSDEEVIKKLCELNGIGIWTAEMTLIFCMQRPDVISWGDLGIQRGLRMLYRHTKINREMFKEYKQRYSPYASVASLYLWAIGGGATELTDLALNLTKSKKG